MHALDKWKVKDVVAPCLGQRARRSSLSNV